jgi:hypothetical protein
MTHLLYFIIIDGVISDESLTVSLYHSGCGENEANIEGKVSTCTAVPIQINRIFKLILSSIVNTSGVTGEPTAFKLAQGPLLRGSNHNIRRGQTPFSPFRIWLSATFVLLIGGGGDHGLLLAVLESSTRSRLWFGWPAGGGECSPNSPRGLR